MALITLTLGVGLLIYSSEGVHDEAETAFPGMLAFTSMLGSRRLFLAVLATMLGVLTFVVTASVLGWHTNVVDPSSFETLSVLAVILVLTALFVWLTASDLRRALSKLEADNERIRESHARIHVLAHHHALTGLPNRLLARDRLEQAIARAERAHQPVALVSLDLDHFKAINDSLGHTAGDLLLCEMAKRKVGVLRISDTVSRQGGDGFAIVVGGVPDESAVVAVAIKINEMLAEPFKLSGTEITATSSLGIAFYPRDGRHCEPPPKCADMAMYRAKDAGRNAFRFFHAAMNTSVIEAMHRISGIRTALAKQEFKLHYQPIFHLCTGKIIGAEALLRRTHPGIGAIPPAKCIPVGERSGLIDDVGAWVLKEAFCRAKSWRDRGMTQMRIAVKLSPSGSGVTTSSATSWKPSPSPDYHRAASNWS